MRLHPRILLVFGLAAAAFMAVPGAVSPRASTALASKEDAVLIWNENAGDAATAACIAPLENPLHESRMYATMHIAIHDALNAIDRRSRPYAFNMRVEQRTSPDAAVAAAARTVLITLINQLPSELTPAACPDSVERGVASVEADYAAALAMIRDGPAKRRGVALGEASAAAILALRATDGAVGPFLNFNCPQNTKPGEFQCLPGTPFIPFEGWADVTPFVLKNSSQFRPGPPYRVTSRKYAADYNEVKSLGGDGVTTPSARRRDQTEIALYWWESSPLKWNRVARIVSPGQGLDLWENARLFGLLNMALADGYIAMKATKNHYNYWRPVTAIRNGDTDGNPRTSGNTGWTPLRGTPPDQDYASGHSIEGGAGAEVLKRFFGTDRIRFRDCSATLPMPLADTACGGPLAVFRSYSTFTHAAVENAHSRIFIGFHFRKSVEEGTAYGRKIGKRAVNLYLRPVH
jgi:PAP2 superfamily